MNVKNNQHSVEITFYSINLCNIKCFRQNRGYAEKLNVY